MRNIVAGRLILILPRNLEALAVSRGDLGNDPTIGSDAFENVSVERSGVQGMRGSTNDDGTRYTLRESGESKDVVFLCAM